ncbi:ABC transporter ATP-binding protein [Butyribacter intestini]|jgi:ATP-binding cassette, subfamily B, multidrug efflux pump|uniref:ABC transporter n=1 Tax=Butyribacter intestini TaxID=1703332 RepID=A0AAW3JSB9_9FIRM|nr:ABC transporter ATP-binding protein [Butyribacter intestini]KQC85399.1 ABC transporter [Butyribacter intestini]RHU74682.1 ABC transporter ATP-binding protein [Butyribacter intestini]UYJ41177.1 MAG: ABC transporter ATP-binding protein/permease [Lachnospiraceae bacterium]
MGKIFKNMLPYRKAVIIIIALLFVQAWCDLSLPSYTSDIIDVGIQNSGVEHIVPEKLTKSEFKAAQFIMTDDEADLWKGLYKADGEFYKLKDKSSKELDEADEKLNLPLIMNYQMSTLEVSSFKKTIANQMGKKESELENVSVEQLGESLGVKLKSFKQEKEDDDGNKVKVDCVDARPFFAGMMQSGKMDKKSILSMRDKMSDTIDAMGSSLVKSMGVAYAVSCDKAAGIDVDHIQKSYLLFAGLKMLGMALLMGVVTVLVGFFASRVGAGIGMTLREKVFKNVVGFSNAEMDKFSTASLITRSTNDIQQIQMVSVMLLRMVAYAPILGIGGVLKVVQTGAGMGWIIVLAIAVILGYVMVLMSAAMPKFKLMQKLVDNINLVSREILTGLSVIRAFGREKKEEERFDEANKDLTKTMLFTNRVMTFMMPGMMMIMNILTVGIVWFGAKKIDGGNMQVGAMTAFITYAMMIVMSFLMLTMMSIMLPRAAVAAERIDEVVRTESSIKDADEPEKLTSHDGVISFEHVNFKYPGAEEDVLHDIDFVARPGETTAIIGSTGCGKSTLVNLIPRLYDVSDGKILLDGKDIRNISMSDLREEIGFVPQKGVLFSGTIASNLRFGNDDATDEEIKKAARIAQATEFIEAKDDKYESSISQGGSNVSGGQKQRLAIARAIAKNPKIFIFDDSFSALDLKTDAALRKALSENVKDSTVIIVAQRISTILHAEQILVLDDGKVVGKGTHEQLLKNCDVYREIAKSQLSAKELGMDESEVSDNE